MVALGGTWVVLTEALTAKSMRLPTGVILWSLGPVSPSEARRHPESTTARKRAPVSGKLGPSSLVYLCALLVEPWLLGSTLVAPRSRGSVS